MRKNGFSLVEVVIALGVISFGVVALVGLLSISISTSKESGDDTTVAAMATAVIAKLRGLPFDDLRSKVVENPCRFDFDEAGNQLPDPAGAVYQCAVEPAGDAASTEPEHLLKVRLIFTWASGAASPSSKVIHASIARY